MRELKEKINELNIKSQKLRTLSKKENPREYKRRDLKEEDIEILLLDEEKENDKTL